MVVLICEMMKKGSIISSFFLQTGESLFSPISSSSSYPERNLLDSPKSSDEEWAEISEASSPKEEKKSEDLKTQEAILELEGPKSPQGTLKENREFKNTKVSLFFLELEFQSMGFQGFLMKIS